MPHRILSPDEVAQYLHLGRAEIERLVKNREIPFETRGGRVVFRVADIDDWASRRILGFNGVRLAEYHRKSSERTRRLLRHEALLPELIRPQFIFPAMMAKTKASVLRDLAALADRTGLLSDLAELVATLQAREQLCPTAVPGGVAFLHPRSPQPYLFQASFLVFGRTLQPIHFGSPDGQPTDLFFLLCCQDDKLHLHTLARLCLMALKTDLLQQLRAAGADAVALHKALLSAEQTVTRGLNPDSAVARQQKENTSFDADPSFGHTGNGNDRSQD
ncbi:MAG TPA: PTS sugar transporter subunit IIA [Verrucomicrobiae bacterium]